MDHDKTGMAHAGNNLLSGAIPPEQHVGVQERGRTETTVPDMIERCRRGDRIAFEPIVKLYEKRVFAYLMACSRNTEEARDLTQDTFIRIWQRWRVQRDKYCGFNNDSADPVLQSSFSSV